MWIDTHCHLSYEDYGSDLPDVIAHALEVGIGHFVTICCRTQEIEALQVLAQSHPFISHTIGIHPHEATETLSRFTDATLYEYLKTHAQNPKVIGLGEMGYDFYYNHSNAADQERIFDIQLRLAQELDLPVSIHTRNAELETIAHLKRYQGVKGVIHCFSGTPFLAQSALDLGFYISLSGIITFPKAQDIRDAIQDVPLERLLLETDAPFLAPIPYRGKRNQPAFMIRTAEKLSEIKGIALAELEKITERNFKILFPKARALLS